MDEVQKESDVATLHSHSHLPPAPLRQLHPFDWLSSVLSVLVVEEVVMQSFRFLVRCSVVVVVVYERLASVAAAAVAEQ